MSSDRGMDDSSRETPARPRPVLERRLHDVHERVALGAIDDPVVEREGDVAHRLDRERVGAVGHLDDLRPFLDRADAHDRDLRLVDDGRREERAEGAVVRHRERAARDLVRHELLGARPRGQVVRGPREAHEREVVGAPDDRHDEAPVESDGDAEVHLAVVHDVVAHDRGVHERARLQRRDRRLEDEGQVRQFRAVLLLEAALHAIAQFRDPGVVDLEDGRDVGRRLLRLDHALRDLLAHRAHRLDGDAASGRERERRRGGRGSARRDGSVGRMRGEGSGSRCRRRFRGFLRRRGRGRRGLGRRCRGGWRSG